MLILISLAASLETRLYRIGRENSLEKASNRRFLDSFKRRKPVCAWVSSLRRRRGNLSSRRRANAKSFAVPCGPGILSVPRPHDSVSESCGWIFADHASTLRSRINDVACGVDLLALASVLEAERAVLSQHASAIGIGRAGCSSFVNPRCWNGTVPHGSVFESAKSRSVCCDLRGSEHTRVEVRTRIAVDRVCSLRSSVDVDVCVLVLCFASSHEAV